MIATMATSPRVSVIHLSAWTDNGPDTVPLYLDERCYRCIGAACGVCGGRGFLLTREGRALLDFLARWQS